MLESRTIEYGDAIDSFVANCPAMARALVPDGLTRYWHQSLGTPRSVFEGTPFEDAPTLPDLISLEDDLRIIANMIAETSERRMLELITNWHFVPGDSVVIFAPDLKAALQFWSRAVDEANPHLACRLVADREWARFELDLDPGLGAFRGFIEIAVLLTLVRPIMAFAGFALPQGDKPGSIYIRTCHASAEQLAIANSFGVASFASGQGSSVIRFPAGLLGIANPEFSSARWEKRQREVLGQRGIVGNGPRLSREVIRGLVRKSLSEQNRAPHALELAHRFSLSERTFARRLADRGISLRDLVNDARMEISQEYLEESSLPVAEIAIRLGYTDASSFIRSFRKRFGLAPGEWRIQRSNGGPRAA